MSAWATPRGISGLKVLKQSPVFIGAISDRFELIRPELKKTRSESVGRNKKPAYSRTRLTQSSPTDWGTE